MTPEYEPVRIDVWPDDCLFQRRQIANAWSSAANLSPIAGPYLVHEVPPRRPMPCCVVYPLPAVRETGSSVAERWGACLSFVVTAADPEHCRSLASEIVAVFAPILPGMVEGVDVTCHVGQEYSQDGCTGRVTFALRWRKDLPRDDENMLALQETVQGQEGCPASLLANLLGGRPTRAATAVGGPDA